MSVCVINSVNNVLIALFHVKGKYILLNMYYSKNEAIIIIIFLILQCNSNCFDMIFFCLDLL